MPALEATDGVQLEEAKAALAELLKFREAQLLAPPTPAPASNLPEDVAAALASLSGGGAPAPPLATSSNEAFLAAFKETLFAGYSFITGPSVPEETLQMIREGGGKIAGGIASLYTRTHSSDAVLYLGEPAEGRDPT
jgi:hypothetical protein